VVIDVDHPELLPEWLRAELADAGGPYQQTRPNAGGRGHYIFRQPEGRQIGCSAGGLAGMGLDVKGAGGVIILEPTYHPDGGEYRLIRHGATPELPAAVAEKLTDTSERESAATDDEVEAFEAEHVEERKRSIRNVYLNKFTAALGPGVSRHETMARFLPAVAEEAMAGYYAARPAFDKMREAFIAAKTRTYNGKAPLDEDAASDEFDGILSWAIGQAKGKTVEKIREKVEGNLKRNGELFLSGATNVDPDDAEAEVNPWRVVSGANFILDQPKNVPALWGEGEHVLWPEGEALMIGAGQGLGKTTLAGLLVRGLLGLDAGVLGQPVNGSGEVILYLAMDRPRQIARSLARQFTGAERELLDNHLIVRPGPPQADLAREPELLVGMMRDLNAGIVFVDSLKDAAVGLSEDEVGAGYNRARQHVLHDGRQVCDLHHVTKASADTINDIYGSTWLTSGCGSVILLTGKPGDPIVGFRHVKQPMDEYGPFKLSHDNDTGRLTIWHETDPVALLRAAGINGLTAKQAAAAMFDTEKPDAGDVEKARRKLDKLMVDYPALGIERGQTPAQKGAQTVWILPAI
jgi:Bifunctional DNA primase/polymerase, N-terminal/AAA domain